MTDHCFEYEMTLEAFVSEEGGTEQAGKKLGLSGSAVHQMLGYRRNVFVKKIKKQWHYCEFKQWKRGKRDKT